MILKITNKKKKQKKTKKTTTPPPPNNRLKNTPKNCHYNHFSIYSMSLLFVFFVRNATIKIGK